jgi:hypothetical protein
MIPLMRHHNCMGYKSSGAFVLATGTKGEGTDSVCNNVFVGFVVGYCGIAQRGLKSVICNWCIAIGEQCIC